MLIFPILLEDSSRRFSQCKSFHRHDLILPPPHSGQYGKKDDYEKIGLATRTCSESGWSGPSNNDKCAGKYTISVKEAEKYFDDTEISDDNVDEYANTINQVGLL